MACLSVERTDVVGVHLRDVSQGCGKEKSEGTESFSRL